MAADAEADAAADVDTGSGPGTGIDATSAETTKTLNTAFLASARGDWETASTLLRGLVEQDEVNYAVRSSCLVGSGSKHTHANEESIGRPLII